MTVICTFGLYCISCFHHVHIYIWYILHIADCVFHDMHIYKYFSLHMFFQVFKNEITALPEPLIDSLKCVPKLLTESKSSG